MTKSFFAAALCALLAASPGIATEKKKPKPKKAETGASCKVAAVGRCAACSIACQPGETATCTPGKAFADACHTQPSCTCTR